MRTLTAGETTTLQAAVRRNDAIVEVQNGDGTWVDRTAWLEGFSFGRTVDDPVTKATVRFRRDKSPAASNSLAPLMEGSDLNRLDDTVTYSPALDAGRGIRISIATVAASTTPVSGDYHLVFRGEIDSVAWQRSPIEVEARDLMGKLRDRFIEEITTYGSDAGVDIETVMQSILTDWLDGETLYGPTGTVADPFPAGDSPGFLVTTTDFGEISVFGALEKLEQLIGWVTRYRWNDDAGDFVLTFYEPDRDKSVADWTFAPNRYIDVHRLDVNRENVRNFIAISYPGADNPLETSDASSIARYGRRWMQFIEGDDSPIDTEPEAQALIDAALADLKEPDAEQEIETLLFWPIELEDLYEFTANGIHYDTDQTWAVVGFDHEVARNTERTRIRVRGSVAGMYNAWLERRRRQLTGVPLALHDVRPIEETETTKTYGWTRSSSRVAEVWIYQAVAEQTTLDPWPDVASTVPVQLEAADEYTFQIPERDKVRYVILEPRDAGLNAGQQWRIKIDPLDPGYPEIEEDDSETQTVGTQFIKLSERGLAVASVQFLTQVGDLLPGSFTTPTRSAGDASTVRGGTLAAGEYEHDVTLAASRHSWIVGKVTLETGEVITLGPYGFDRDKRPTFVTVEVDGQKVRVIGDTDTESLKLERIDGGGTWERSEDGYSFTFDLTKPDPSSNAGIGTDIWQIRVTAYNDPTAEIDGETLSETAERVVTGAGAAAAPTWDFVTAGAPALSSDAMTLDLDADSVTTETLRVTARHRLKTGTWLNDGNITSSLSPSVTQPPNSATQYTFATGDTHTGSGLQVTYEITAEILDGSLNAVASETVQAAWITS